MPPAAFVRSATDSDRVELDRESDDRSRKAQWFCRLARSGRCKLHTIPRTLIGCRPIRAGRLAPAPAPQSPMHWSTARAWLPWPPCICGAHSIPPGPLAASSRCAGSGRTTPSWGRPVGRLVPRAWPRSSRSSAPDTDPGPVRPPCARLRSRPRRGPSDPPRPSWDRSAPRRSRPGVAPRVRAREYVGTSLMLPLVGRAPGKTPRSEAKCPECIRFASKHYPGGAKTPRTPQR